MNECVKKVKGKVTTHLLLPLVLGACVFFIGIGISIVDFELGVIPMVVSLIYMLIVFIMYKINKPIMVHELISFAMEYAQVQKELLQDFVIPYGLLDKSGDIMWQNAKLKEILGKEDYKTKPINSALEELNLDDIEELEENEVSSQEIIHNGRNYRVELKKVNVQSIFGRSNILNLEDVQEYLIAVYLFDITEEKRLTKENYEQKMIAGLIYIDNYEEALQSVEEVRRSLLTALIDRKLNKYAANVDAVLRKVEKDKYVVVLKQKYLDVLQSDKFSIIDDVKTVSIGNDISVTISIGLGVGGATYNDNFDYARTAIDLALGRGGDQAVVKDGDKVYYYGGKTKQVEKNTRVKARVKAHALREVLQNKDKVMIMGHKIGDVDSFGASIGVYRTAKAMNKKAHIVINEITSSVRPMIERFIESDEYEEDLFLNSHQALEEIDNSTVVVVVDVSRPSYTECEELLEKSKATVVLDHHRQSSEIIENAVLSYIEPYASSACEMVAEILQYIQDGIKIKPLEADAMYGGIMIDTNNFSQKTGVRTFEAAAFLRRNGADITRVKKMFRNDIGDYKARATAVSNAEVFLDAFAISECPSENIESPTVTGAQAANELLNINGIKASFVLTSYNDLIYISARSIDEINVQLIMERLGGGGHMNVAGAQLENCTVEEAKIVVKDTVREMISQGEI
ncbi:MAG: DHH family phosphoesterase [Lachnospiraceae bacterium]|nr:DHH family phosphoesterase [Lachnospiraceae bacterium]